MEILINSQYDADNYYNNINHFFYNEKNDLKIYTPFSNEFFDQASIKEGNTLQVPPPEKGNPLGIPVGGNELLFFYSTAFLYLVIMRIKKTKENKQGM